ncbi:MAG: TRAP transporter TatT component family protein [Gammaproteobacteria bacterium]|nr:TRAP transporter TatT component family protein [Gammaproteobacteria bacterium]MDH5388292.1 TRAP transporter TatT component family protein [Gammaproteobacteria bacterium]
MIRITLLLLISAVISGCSIDQMLVRASTPLIEGGIYALNQEADLQLAENSIPTNLNMLEGMISIDPDNDSLRVYAAQAYYGLAYGFNEDNKRQRAVNFYLRGLKHGLHALDVNGYKNIRNGTMDELEAALMKMDDDDVGALFWTASNWAKWIDQNRDKSESLIELPKPTALMQRVLELDDTFYYGGAHMYFGVFYGGRSPMFGGDFKKSEAHFDRAREITNNDLLVADLLQAQYLSRQKMDQEDFHNRLTKIINAPVDLHPDLVLLNQIAKRKAVMLLKEEEKWF